MTFPNAVFRSAGITLAALALLVAGCIDDTEDVHDIRVRPCQQDGETFLHGELVSQDDCTRCSCQDSVVSCIPIPTGCTATPTDAGQAGD